MRKIKVSWLLPGATLTHVSDRADPAGRRRRRAGQANGSCTGDRLSAVVEDDRLTARLHYPGIGLLAPVLHARLLQEDRGILVKGEILPTQLVGWLLWLLVAIVLVGAAAQALVAGNAWAMIMVAVMASAFAVVTPGLWRAASRHQQDAVGQLEAALLARFAVDD